MSEEQVMTQSDEVTEVTEDLVGTFKDEKGTVMTPWKAEGIFNSETYDRLVEEFGVQRITPELLERFQKVTGCEPHFWLKRGIFFAHRQLEEVLDDFEAGKKIFLYTGRGPTTDALHLGHIISYYFTAWLQKVFNADVVIQMADDEKSWFKTHMDLHDIVRLGYKNARDIIACGFDAKKTFIFSNNNYCGEQPVKDIVFEMMKRTNAKTVQKIFGLNEMNTVGQYSWPFYQTAAAFSPYYEKVFGGEENVRCLVAYAIDQDPYFRLGRDIAPKMGLMKPCSIMMVFLPALEGDEKMSSTAKEKSTGEMATIFMTDSPEQIMSKVNKYAFSGGQETLAKHKELGGNCDVDISYQYMRYFLEDDVELEDIRKRYSSGEMTSSEIKKRMANVVTEIVVKHQKARAEITDADVFEFYRPLFVGSNDELMDTIARSSGNFPFHIKNKNYTRDSKTE